MDPPGGGMTEPTLRQAIGHDPWLTAKMRAQATLDRADKDVSEGVRLAFVDFLSEARKIMADDPGRAPDPAAPTMVGPITAALTAAADRPPDLGQFPDRDTWVTAITRRIVPRLWSAFGEAWRRFARSATISAEPYRENFLQGVYSRLSPSKWPDRVWDEVQYEISEAITQGESYDQMNERLGDLLQINALSRKLRARAAELRAIRDNPDTSTADRAAARRELRDVYARYDEADLMWLGDVRRIARTETHMAVNGGTYQSAVAWQIESGERQFKRWLSTPDARVREAHRHADGQVVELTAPFTVDNEPLLFPGDPAGSGSNTIQCRCALLILSEEEGRAALANQDSQQPLTASGGSTMTTTETTAVGDDVFATGAADERPDTDLPPRWKGILAPLDTLTGDRRILATPPGGKLRMRDHRPLLFQPALASGHDGGVIVGHIDRAWIEDRDGVSFVMGEGRFDLGSEDGREAARMMRDGFLRGVSVDADDITDSWVCHDGDQVVPCPREDDELADGTPEVFEAGRLDDWRLMGATLVSHPAFAAALLEPVWEEPVEVVTAAATNLASASTAKWAIVGDAALPFADRDHRWDGSGAKRRLLQAATRDDGSVDAAKLARGFVYRDNDADPATQAAYSLPFADIIDGQLRAVWNGVAAAAAAVQGARGGTSIPADELAAVRTRIGRLYDRAAKIFDDASITPPWDDAGEHATEDVCIPCMAGARSLVAAGPLAPPSHWFADPQLTDLTPLQVTRDGRVYGHAADRYGCHTGYPGACVLPPMDGVGFDLFHHGHVLSAEGEDIPVGNLIVGTDHAPLKAGAMSAFRHYADTGSGVAVVRAGVDQFGIWVAGALTPDATDVQIYTLRRSSLSGDWREVNGRIQFVAALAVNVPGFPIPRTHRRTAHAVTTMVAVGAVPARHTHLDDEERERRVAELASRMSKAAAVPAVAATTTEGE